MERFENLLDFVNELNETGRIQYDDYSRLFDLVQEFAGAEEAISAAATAMHMPTVPPSRFPSQSESTVFRKSPKNVSAPARRPKTRATFVAPAFPLPSPRMS